ncbi:hypothetical protein [Streptomyces sp. NPDC101132]|uniref:hypothetical protein n=1 Tax=Streptomyces sp. NPDC101132 TaxID=3366110 RepID=UPI0038200B6D
MGPVLLTAAVVVAVFVVRAAVVEMRHPGSALVRWSLLRDARTLRTGAFVAGPLAVVGWVRAGAEGLVWGLLVAALVAYAVSKLRAE